MSVVDLSKLAPEPEGVAELYPTEKNALKNMVAGMMRAHSFKGVVTIKRETEIKQAFTNEVRARCAELGLRVDVLWEWESDEKDPDGFPLVQSPAVSSDPNDNSLYWVPKVVVTARIDKVGETDHDRYRFEVINGMDGGTPGYIREDGTRREDLRKKNIY